MDNINWLSMGLAIITPLFIGFFYYHKALFGKAWMDSIGMTNEKAKEANKAVIFGVSIIFSFLLSFLLLYLYWVCTGLCSWLYHWPHQPSQ